MYRATWWKTLISGMVLLSVAAGAIIIAVDNDDETRVLDAAILCGAALVHGFYGLRFIVGSFYIYSNSEVGTAMIGRINTVDSHMEAVIAIVLVIWSGITLDHRPKGLAFTGTILVLCGEAAYLAVNFAFFLIQGDKEGWASYDRAVSAEQPKTMAGYSPLPTSAQPSIPAQGPAVLYEMPVQAQRQATYWPPTGAYGANPASLVERR